MTAISKERVQELIAFHNTKAVMAESRDARSYYEDSHAALLELLRLRESAE